MALHGFGEYVSSFCSHGFFNFFLGCSYPAVSQVIGWSGCSSLPMVRGRRKTRRNLGDCICLRSEVETASPSCVIIAIIINFVIAIATTAKCLSKVY